MMNCAEVKALFDAWERGEVRFAETHLDELGRHLDSCTACGRALGPLLPLLTRDIGETAAQEGLEPGNALIRAAGNVPPEFVDGVMDAISEGSGGRIFSEKQRAGAVSATRGTGARRLRSLPVFAAAAVVVFIIGMGFGFYFFRGRNEDTVKVSFMLYAPDASSVELAGDFTSWNPGEFALKKVDAGGLWEIQIPLRKGHLYVYNFVINGNIWIPDPKALGIIDDGFGGQSSLLRL